MDAFASRRRPIDLTGSDRVPPFALADRVPDEPAAESPPRRSWRITAHLGRPLGSRGRGPGPSRPGPWERYAAAAGLGGLAAAVQLALGPESPLQASVPAVVAASWLGGFGPALGALGVALAGGAWAGATGPALPAAALAGGGLAWFGGRMRSGCDRAAAQRGEALAQLQDLEVRRREDREEHERSRRESAEAAEALERRLEARLREKDALLEAVLRHVPSGVIVVSAETSELIAGNERAMRVVRDRFRADLPIADQLATSGLVGRRADGSAYAADEWPLLRALRHGEATEGEEIELAFEDGARRRLRVDCGPVRDEEGRVVAAVAAFDDVTERRAAEDALIESERRFRRLADAIPQLVYITRADDSVAYLNRRWFDYTGASSEHVEVKDAWLGAIHPDDAGRVVAARSRSKVAGEPTEIEYRIRGADGRYRWFLGRSMWIRDERGGLLQRFGTATDIDDRRRAEMAARFLADAAARLAAVADAETALREIARVAVPDFADWCAVDLLDEDGSLRRVAVAHDSEDQAGVIETISHRYRLRPDMPQGLYQVVETRRPSLVADVTDEVLAAAARNEEHLAALRAFAPRSYLCAPLVGRDGVLGALSFATTRSGRRYDRADLELAVDVAGRAATALENGRLYDQLREADRRKDDFLATLAHELRNPMAPIRNSVQILRMKKSGDPDSRWAVEVIERQVAHMVRLVQDLVDVSRITRDKLALQVDRIDLAAAIADAVETTRPILDGQGQRLRLDLPEGPLPVKGDRTRLAQVVANLLDNASKFSARESRIDLGVARVGGLLEVRVRDEGIGIPASQLPHVFDRVAHATPILQRPHGGLGIGLALVKGLVELHEGTVEARSDGPDLGSEFVVRIPAAPDGPAATGDDGPRPSREARPAPAVDGGRKVLIVDDSEDVAASLGRLLALEGFDVHLAHDGPSGLAMAAALRPDYAVLDIGMPGMDGYELARAIRCESWGGGIKLIAVTGWGRSNDRRRSAEAGFDHHLVKPVQPDAIVELIARPA